MLVTVSSKKCYNKKLTTLCCSTKFKINVFTYIYMGSVNSKKSILCQNLVKYIVKKYIALCVLMIYHIRLPVDLDLNVQYGLN